MFDPYDMKAQKEITPYLYLLLVFGVVVVVLICTELFGVITHTATVKEDFVNASNAVVKENYELVIDGMCIDMEQFDTNLLYEESYEIFLKLYEVLEINHETDTVKLKKK